MESGREKVERGREKVEEGEISDGGHEEESSRKSKTKRQKGRTAKNTKYRHATCKKPGTRKPARMLRSHPLYMSRMWSTSHFLKWSHRGDKANVTGQAQKGMLTSVSTSTTTENMLWSLAPLPLEGQETDVI